MHTRQFSITRAFAMLVVGLTLSACGGRTAFPLIPVADATSPNVISGKHEVYVATTRAKADDPAFVFSGSRGEGVSFARIGVTVPAIHKTGMIEHAQNRRPDPARYFTPTQIALFKNTDSFRNDFDKQVRAKGGRALVFIHGYNTSFDAAVYRATQIVHDADYQGAPVLFTWASAGRALDYVYDSNSAAVARDGLEQTLRMLAKSGVQRIDIIAHSMGTWLTMEALRQLAMTGDGNLGGKLGDVVLASPDIDIDVFSQQMKRYGKPTKPFVLMVSRDDRALRVSGLIAGNRPRVGGYDDDAKLAELGVTVADLTGVTGSSTSLNHTKFAENPLLIQMLGSQLKADSGLGTDSSNATDRVQNFGTALGQTVVSAASIVITTPFEVFNVVLGQ